MRYTHGESSTSDLQHEMKNQQETGNTQYQSSHPEFAGDILSNHDGECMIHPLGDCYFVAKE